MISLVTVKLEDNLVIRSSVQYVSNVLTPLRTNYKEEVFKEPNIEEQLTNIAISRGKAIDMIYNHLSEKKYSSKGLDFFSDALDWFWDVGDKAYLSGLYEKADFLMPVTWSELGYWWFYVLGNENPVELKSLKPYVKVCVLKETDPDQKTRLNFKLPDYKNMNSMMSYLYEIQRGTRYMPICLFHAFEGLRELGYVNKGEFFKEITESELEKFLNKRGM